MKSQIAAISLATILAFSANAETTESMANADPDPMAVNVTLMEGNKTSLMASMIVEGNIPITRTESKAIITKTGAISSIESGWRLSLDMVPNQPNTITVGYEFKGEPELEHTIAEGRKYTIVKGQLTEHGYYSVALKSGEQQCQQMKTKDTERRICIELI